VRQFFCVLLLFLPCLINAAALAQEQSLVVTSVRPLTLIVKDLGGDWLDVRQLLKDGQEPHHVSLTISQRRLIDDAQLVFWVGPALENYLSQGIASRSERSALSLEAIASSEFPEVDAHVDAHLWLQPDVVAAYYRAVAALLDEHFPAHRERIEARLEQALAKLSQTIAQIATDFEAQRVAGKTLVVDHQAYGYFTGYFGISVAGALVDARGLSIGARSLAELGETAQARCVVVERLPAPSRARRVATALDLPLVAIDPLGMRVDSAKGYSGLLEDIAAGFARCLAPASQGHE